MLRSAATFPSGRPAGAMIALAAAVVLAVLGAPAVEARQTPSQKGAEVEARRLPDELNFANGLYRDRRYDLAAEEYEKFLKTARPGADADDARYGLANAFLFLGKYKDARRVFEDFVRVSPTHPNAPTALFRVGETAYLLGDHAAAKAALERFVALNPRHRHAETAYSHLGDVYFRTADLPKAKAAYRTVLASAVGPASARARLGLARVLSSLREYDEARTTLAELAKSGGPEWLDKAWLEMGRVEMGAERFDPAVKAFETLETAAPRSPLTAEARLLRADCLVRLERRAEAEAILAPLSSSGHVLAASASDALGACYLAGGETQRAFDHFVEALKRFPNSQATASLAFHAAEAAQKLNRVDDACARYLKLCEAFPSDPLAEAALLRAAAIRLDQGKLDEARQLAEGYPTRFPAGTLLADARLIEGRAELSGGQAKAAVAILEDALGKTKPAPRTAQAIRYYLGLAYRASGQAEKSTEVLGMLAKTSTAPAAADAQFLLGQGHIEAGRFAEALPALEGYLRSKPDGDVADFALAHKIHAEIELGQADQAGRTLAELARRFPKSKALGTSRLRLAEALLSAKKFEAAAELFAQAAEGAAELKPRAFSGLGWSLLQAGKNPEAAEAFGKLLAAAPDDPLAADAALTRGKALERAGRREDAVAAFELATERYAKSEAAGPALVAKARALVELKKPADAAESFARAVKEYPKSAGESLDALLAEWGWALVDAGKAENADEVFQRLLTEFPESPKSSEARFNLAESAFAARKFDAVEDLLKPVVAEDSKAAPGLIQSALYRLGRTWVERKSWTEAAAAFDQLSTRYPEGPYRKEARFWRAEIAFQAGDGKAAESAFAALGKEPVEPGDAAGFLGAVRGRRVQSLILLERWADAVAAADAFKAEFPKDPQLPEVLFAKGRAAQGLAKFDEARAAFDEAVHAGKGTEIAAKSQFMKGETYFHQKSYRDALKEFLKVDYLYAAPVWQAAALLEAGKVHEQLSQWAEAAETYERLRMKFPDDASADKARSRLDAVRKRIAAAPGPTDRADAGR